MRKLFQELTVTVNHLIFLGGFSWKGFTSFTYIQLLNKICETPSILGVNVLLDIAVMRSIVLQWTEWVIPDENELSEDNTMVHQPDAKGVIYFLIGVSCTLVI